MSRAEKINKLKTKIRNNTPENENLWKFISQPQIAEMGRCSPEASGQWFHKDVDKKIVTFFEGFDFQEIMEMGDEQHFRKEMKGNQENNERNQKENERNHGNEISQWIHFPLLESKSAENENS